MSVSAIYGKKRINVLNLPRFQKHSPNSPACLISLPLSASGHMDLELASVAPLLAETRPSHTN